MSDQNNLVMTDLPKGIEKYNPDRLGNLEVYVETQIKNNIYDFETNLGVLKLYQFFPNAMKIDITQLILLKTLTNFPHNDFTLCKYLLIPIQMENDDVQRIIQLADILEQCDFEQFWGFINMKPDMFYKVTGFHDSIRKFVCHVVGITFQTIKKPYLARLLGDIDNNTLAAWIKKYGWKDQGELVFISSQDENIKTKNITENIEFENLASIMASCL